MSKDVVWGIILGAGTIFLMISTYQPKEGAFIESLGGMFWPRVILWGLLTLSLLLTFNSLRESRQKNQKKAVESTSMGMKRFKKPIYLLLTCGAYFFFLNYVGFICGTLLFIAATMVVLGCTSWKQVFFLSIGSVLVLWFVFLHLFHLPLPKGIWVFRDITLFFT